VPLYVIYDCSVGLLTRNDLTDGTIDISDVPRSAAAFLDKGLLVASVEGDTLRFYPSWEDTLRGFADEYALLHFDCSRMGAEGDRVYFAWHSTGFVDRFSLSSQSDLGPMPLEGFEGWLRGMDITSDGWLVINSGSLGDMLQVFDAETGTELLRGGSRSRRSALRLAVLGRDVEDVRREIVKRWAAVVPRSRPGSPVVPGGVASIT
jgi:hypothetical protein